MREVCFCEETHFSFIYTSYFSVLLAGPKEAHSNKPVFTE